MTAAPDPSSDQPTVATEPVTLLVDHLRAMAGAYPTEVAYRVLDVGSVTFAEWEQESNRLARALVARGVGRGERVALVLAAGEALRFMVAYAAVHKAGAVAVPVNPQLAVPELRRVLDHAGPVAACVDASTSDAVTAAGLPRVPALLACPTDDAVPPWSWGACCGAQEATTFQVPLHGEDLADILYTSGTTGQPKGVAVRHRAAALIPGPPTPSYSGRCWLHASPLSTFAGIGFVYNPMQLGLCGIYQPRFDAGRWLAAVAEHRPSFVFLVPAMAALLLDHPAFAAADLSCIELCAVGSAPLAPATLRALQRAMPNATVSNSYGMTEAGAAFCAMPPGEAERRIGSVGQPLAPLEVRIVGEDSTVLRADEVGEIWLRLPGRQREYYRDEAATAETWQDGWLRTGDLGRLDADGFLFVVGRRKDVIIRGGNNVHAADVEAVLIEHPEVAEAAVVGVAHPVLGEDVAAAVVPRRGARLDPEALRRHCAERLAPAKVPRRWLLVSTLPRTPTGKVRKEELRAWFSDGPAS
jgi:acyl-CoA synthetase (AMP-forming)/AMP-acid ligase II